MEDWFHSILEHLYKKYPLDHSFHNINDFLINELKINSKIPNHLHRLSAILHILKDKKYIDGSPQVKNKNELTRGQVIGILNHGAGYSDMNSLLTHNIEVRLTIDGYVYMQARELKSEEHQSLIITNRISRRNNFWTPFIAGIAVIISGVALFKQIEQNPKNETLQATKESLLRKLDTLEQSVRAIDSGFRTMVNDSTKNFSIGTKHIKR